MRSLLATLAVAFLFMVGCSSGQPPAFAEYRACDHEIGDRYHDTGEVVAHGFDIDEDGDTREWWDLVADGSPFGHAKRIYRKPSRSCGALGDPRSADVGWVK